MASGLLDAVNGVLEAVGNIPYGWTALGIERNRPDNLFQLVRMWNDQVNREKSGAGYTYAKPACFLEIRNMDNTMFAEGVSYAEYIWRFHIVDMELDAGDEQNMDQNLSVIGYRDALKQAIAGYQPPNCSTLFPVNEEQDYQHSDVYHYILDMKSGFTDLKGTILDPDQTTVIYKDPPTNAELDTAFQVPPDPNPLAPQLVLNITPTLP